MVTVCREASIYICDGIYLRPGVPGRPVPYRCCAALAGLRIWNEHMRVSSTVIIAPALSNSPQ